MTWFFRQWVYQTGLPSYRMECSYASDADGSVIVSGKIFQEGQPEGADPWFMPLPVVMTFQGDRVARGAVAAYGPETVFSIRLPEKPRKIELDPEYWVLSEKTSTKEVR